MPDNKTDIEAIKRELERKSQDTIRVFNPTQKDRKVVWNRFIHLVKRQEEAVLPRYIAEKFVRETVDLLIGEKNLERVQKENDRRIRAGMKAMDAQEREVFDWRIDNPELRKQYIPMVYRGVASEYGKLDEAPTITEQKVTYSDTDIYSDIDKALEKSRREMAAKEGGLSQDLAKAKKEAISKVAA